MLDKTVGLGHSFFIFSLTGDFEKKMESRGRNKNKNKT